MSNFPVRIGAIVTLPAVLLTLAIPIHPAAAGDNEFGVCVSELTESGVNPNQAGVACSDALIPKELSECVGAIRAETPIDPESAVTACYQVRRPVDMAGCVVDIHVAVLPASSPQASKSEKPADKKEIQIVQEPAPQAPEGTQPEAPEGMEPSRPTQPEAPAGTEPSPPANVEPPANTEEDSPSYVALDSCRRSLLPDRHSECVIGLSENVPDLAPVRAMETCLSAEDFPRDLFPAFGEN